MEFSVARSADALSFLRTPGHLLLDVWPHIFMRQEEGARRTNNRAEEVVMMQNLSIVFTGPGALELRRDPVPEPNQNQILVETTASQSLPCSSNTWPGATCGSMI